MPPSAEAQVSQESAFHFNVLDPTAFESAGASPFSHADTGAFSVLGKVLCHVATGCVSTSASKENVNATEAAFLRVMAKRSGRDETTYQPMNVPTVAARMPFANADAIDAAVTPA